MNNLVRKLDYFGNEITIRINGIGEHNFIFIDVIDTIQSIYLNNILIDKPASNKILLKEKNNRIKIKFFLERLKI